MHADGSSARGHARSLTGWDGVRRRLSGSDTKWLLILAGEHSISLSGMWTEFMGKMLNYCIFVHAVAKARAV